MKNFELLISTKATLLIGFITFSLLSFAQENPWKTKKTENPWGTTEEKVEEKEEAVSETIIVQKDTSTIVIEPTQVLAEENIIEKGSTEKPESFAKPAVKKTHVKNETLDVYQIERESEKEYRAGTGFAVSAVTSVIPGVNLIALPFNVAAIFIPTYQERIMVSEFEEKNPTASHKEIKAVKRGIRRKKAKRSGGGIALGTGILGAIALILMN